MCVHEIMDGKTEDEQHKILENEHNRPQSPLFLKLHNNAKGEEITTGQR